MESFFLAETTKYLYLLFDTDNFIHNQGQQGSSINTVNGKCVIETGGYIFNTEAHPIDIAALHCCHNIPGLNLFDFTDLNLQRSLLKSETISERTFNTKREILCETDCEKKISKAPENNVEFVINSTDKNVFNIGSNNSHIRISDIDLVSINVTQNVETDYSKNNSSESNLILESQADQLDPQQMLERIKKQTKYLRYLASEHDYKLLSCRSQSFMQKLSILGEFFNT